MADLRTGGPKGVIRPFEPARGVDDARYQMAEALEHIARALSAIDHNLEALAKHSQRQTAALERIADGQGAR